MGYAVTDHLAMWHLLCVCYIGVTEWEYNSVAQTKWKYILQVGKCCKSYYAVLQFYNYWWI